MIFVLHLNYQQSQIPPNEPRSSDGYLHGGPGPGPEGGGGRTLGHAQEDLSVCLGRRPFCGRLWRWHALCNRSIGGRLRCVIEATIQPNPFWPKMDDGEDTSYGSAKPRLKVTQHISVRIFYGYFWWLQRASCRKQLNVGIYKFELRQLRHLLEYFRTTMYGCGVNCEGFVSPRITLLSVFAFERCHEI